MAGGITVVIWEELGEVNSDNSNHLPEFSDVARSP